MRALLDLLITIIVALFARAILSSLMKGVTNSARTGFNPQQPGGAASAPPPPKEPVTITGELHKDPVCGTYVAESTRFQRSVGREHFYYCSEACKDKHTVVARS